MSMKRPPIVLNQGVSFELRPDGDVNVTITTVRGNDIKSTMEVMSQLDFSRQAAPIVSQFSPAHKDKITDLLPKE